METTQEITINISLLSENYSFQKVMKVHLKKNSMYSESSFCFRFWNSHNEKPKNPHSLSQNIVLLSHQLQDCNCKTIPTPKQQV